MSISWNNLIQLIYPPRVPGGPIPMMILEGHQSRLDPRFINYINYNSHPWKICLGMPYPTASPHASDDEGGDEDDYPSPTASPHAGDDEGGDEN